MGYNESDLSAFTAPGQAIEWQVHCTPPQPETDDCDNSGPNCMKVAELAVAGVVAVGDTTPGHDGTVLVFGQPQWAAFEAAARGGQFSPV